MPESPQCFFTARWTVGFELRRVKPDTEVSRRDRGGGGGGVELRVRDLVTRGKGIDRRENVLDPQEQVLDTERCIVQSGALSCNSRRAGRLPKVNVGEQAA